MPAAGQPAGSLRDRAERHVFARLPDLPAVERRVLALLELADGDRAAAGADTGLDDTALRFAAKRARKALRRESAPLSAGARCERAELLISDRLDAPLPRDDRRWLEVHLGRCPRCAEHQRLLAAAREELLASFTAQPPALEAPPEPRGHLRAVPDPPPPGDTTDEMGPLDPERKPSNAASADRAAPPARTAVTSAAAKRTLKVLAVLLVLAAAVVAALAGLDAVVAEEPQRAPWAAPDAPEVRPAPLTDQ